MASITIRGYPTIVMHNYQVVRIGNNKHDPKLDFCLPDKSLDKLHATLTRCDKGLYVVNESRNGSVSIHGQRFSGPILVTFRDAIYGCVKLRFGNVDALLRVSCSLGA